MQDGEVTLYLQKMRKGETWAGDEGPRAADRWRSRRTRRGSCWRGSARKSGFDFSNAEFNGQIPDARKFMGGVKYN